MGAVDVGEFCEVATDFVTLASIVSMDLTKLASARCGLDFKYPLVVGHLLIQLQNAADHRLAADDDNQIN